MSPVDAFHLYISIKLHFSIYKYSAEKYHYKTKANFAKRTDNYQFTKLAKHKDPKGLLISNLSHDPTMWVGKLYSTEARKRYTDWLGYRESMPYFFSEQLNTLDTNSFRTVDNVHPEALKKYIRKKLALDTLTICNDFIGFVDSWNKVMANDPLWVRTRLAILKNKTFLQYDRNLFKEILSKWLKAS